MPDFTMCEDHHCLSSNICKRYTSPPNEVQAYQDFGRVGDRCDWILPINGTNRILFVLGFKGRGLNNSTAGKSLLDIEAIGIFLVDKGGKRKVQ